MKSSNRMTPSGRKLEEFLFPLSLLLALVLPSNAQIMHQSKNSVVVIGIDGGRWDLVNSTTAPNLDQLAKNGVRGEMIPVWPTVSAPNHWALATGLYPMHNGVYGNDLYDPATGKDFDWTKEDWGRGEAFWTTVANQGGISVVVNWAGGLFRAGKNRPSFAFLYSPKMDRDLVVGSDNRAQLILDLLDQSPESRPDLIAFWVDDVDDAEHLYGVQSPQANEALRKVDEMVGKLVEGIRLRDDEAVDIVIVADHGQMNTSTDKNVYLDDYIDIDKLMDRHSMASGPEWALWPKKGAEGDIFSHLQNANPHLKVLRAEELPKRFHCCSDREPPLFAIVDTGWNLSVRGADPFAPGVHGNHGYDNEVREMHSLFIANGPDIQSGVKLEPFNNVDIYSFLATLLKVKPAKTDGSLRSLCSALVTPPASCSAGQ